uniref:NKAP domain containing 1 n=1 Tax=Pelusios castaneus TaxID=367368 RepID=A0A8C8VLY9_9SAUR
MSRVPLGKVLLRNVIRHTDAHNKIQEESEMWKIRELEKQTQETYRWKQGRMSPNTSSSRMRSDGFDEESQRAYWKAKNFVHVPDMIDDDLLRARTWNKKLYECEANMPDRWGHSGYKELYPEEFDTDSDQQERDEKITVNGKRKSHSGKKSAHESLKRKRPKKSQKKKQKKKSHKKRKKRKKEKAKASSDSSQESECSEMGTSGTRKGKHKHKKKTRKMLSREPVSSSGQESDSSNVSSSEDSESEQEKEKWSKKRRRKCPVSASERHSEIQEKQCKRKNWKVAADEKSDDSSDED